MVSAVLAALAGVGAGSPCSTIAASKGTRVRAGGASWKSAPARVEGGMAVVGSWTGVASYDDQGHDELGPYRTGFFTRGVVTAFWRERGARDV